MKRIRVPDGMLKAAAKDVFYSGDPDALKALELRLEAALLWLSDHPQVPTEKQIQDVQAAAHREPLYATKWMSDVLQEWQRRCFVQEEPEIPEEIEDLLIENRPHVTFTSDTFNEALLEAFRRGLRKGEQK